MKAIESLILREAREVFANRKLRLKDILEWRCGPFEAKVQIEIVERLPREGFYVCIFREHDRRVKQGVADNLAQLDALDEKGGAS